MLHSLVRSVDSTLQPAYRAHDALVDKMTRRAVKATQRFLIQFIEDPYMPWILKRAIRKAWRLTCNEVTGEIVEKLLEKFGWADRQLDRFRLKGWCGPPQLCFFGEPGVGCTEATRRLLVALRAKWLYASQPADGSIWSVIRDPLGLLILALKLQPTTSLFAFVLTFVLIDRSDEFQLVDFIVKVKAFKAFSDGVIPAVRLGLGYHACVTAVAAGRPHECIESVPSSSTDFPRSLAMDVAQLVIVWIACVLLLCSHAYGGQEEVAALEYARLDAADGSLDGEFSGSIAERDAERGREGAAEAMAVPRPARLDTVNRCINEQRRKRGVARRTGGLVPPFLLADLCTLLLLLGVWAIGSLVLDYAALDTELNRDCLPR